MSTTGPLNLEQLPRGKTLDELSVGPNGTTLSIQGSELPYFVHMRCNDRP
jgi:hypothetical protein